MPYFKQCYKFTRVPTAQGKQGKCQKRIPVMENREFENFAKTQGILFVLVVNSLILKLGSSQFCVYNSHKLCKLTICGWTGKKQGKHREFENTI